MPCVRLGALFTAAPFTNVNVALFSDPYERPEGFTAFTVRFSCAVSEPPELDAVIVYTASGDTVVGVPLITPVCLSSESPEGNEGDTAY